MVNQKLCEIVGYSLNELLNLTYQELTHPDDLVADLELGQRMMAKEVHEKSREKRYRHKNGYYIWVNLTSSLVWDAGGKPKYTTAPWSTSGKTDDFSRGSHSDCGRNRVDRADR